MSTKGDLKVGDRFGDWVIEDRIDGGGNADVWRVRHQDGRAGAINILRNLGVEPYGRFLNEITALRKLGELDGIVPMLDHSFPEGKGAKPWYVMPLAANIASHLGAMDSKAIVREFVSLGETLVELHARGMAHRDIKPQNILAYRGRLCFSDFGLVKYPDLTPITPERRDVGAKFTMAPEMRREASAADGLAADVFSFAKTLWICLTGEPLGFDGPYLASSNVGLQNYLLGSYTTTLDDLMSDCTQHDPAARPTIEEVVDRLRDWLRVIDDFFLRNAREWEEFAKRFFPIQTPTDATWIDIDAVATVLNEVAKVPSLNHMFLPDGGGFTLKAARRAPEQGFIELDVGLIILLKPAKLTFVSFSLDTKWDYLRLEATPVAPTRYYDVQDGAFVEYLSELAPAQYAHPDVWEYRSESERKLPPGSRSVSRYLNGCFVFFSTSSPYNQAGATYDARHQKMSEFDFRNYMHRSALRSAAKSEVS